MPELPEVETVRRGLQKVLLGRSFEQVQVIRHDLRVPVPLDFAARIISLPCVEIERRGKYIILIFEGNQAAVLHLGMSGRIRIYKHTAPSELEKHDHIILKIVGGGTVIYNDPRRFGMFYTTDARNWAQEKPFAGMGPEPLGAWSGPDLQRELKGKTAAIKLALLDQAVVCGLGNIYVCEALFDAGIHPSRSAADLTPSECDRLVWACRAVLEKAIQAGGSTLRDYQKTDGSLGYFQYQFFVYGRAGAPCLKKSCSGVIERIIQANRSTFSCPVCQKSIKL